MDEFIKEKDWAHLQPAVVLLISRLLKSPEEASRTCGKRHLQFNQIQLFEGVEKNTNNGN